MPCSFVAPSQGETLVVETAPELMRVMTAVERGDGSVMGLARHELVTVVARATGEPWNQRLVKTTTHIDGNLASLWSTYVFDRGNAFDHCGVIGMHLARVGGHWRVLNVVDTHRASDCDRE